LPGGSDVVGRYLMSLIASSRPLRLRLDVFSCTVQITSCVHWGSSPAEWPGTDPVHSLSFLRWNLNIPTLALSSATLRSVGFHVLLV